MLPRRHGRHRRGGVVLAQPRRRGTARVRVPTARCSAAPRGGAGHDLGTEPAPRHVRSLEQPIIPTLHRLGELRRRRVRVLVRRLAGQKITDQIGIISNVSACSAPGDCFLQRDELIHRIKWQELDAGPREYLVRTELLEQLPPSSRRSDCPDNGTDCRAVHRRAEQAEVDRPRIDRRCRGCPRPAFGFSMPCLISW